MIKSERWQCWIHGLQVSFIAPKVYGYCHMKRYKPIVILTFSSNWHPANVLTLLIYGIGWIFFFSGKNKPSESLSLHRNLRTERNEGSVSRFGGKKALPLRKSDIQLCPQVIESYNTIFQQNERDLQSPLQGLQDRIIWNISTKTIDCKSTFSFYLPTFLILKACTITVKYMELKNQLKLHTESLISDQREAIWEIS